MRVALISVVSLVAACGGDGVSISTNQDNFCSEIAEVACHNMYQCCTESEIEDRLSVSDPRTEQQCREDYERICERSAPDVRDSLKAKRITFDANRLNACLDAVLAPSDTCSEVVMELPWKAPCKDAPWVGTVDTGGSCFFNFDCKGAPDSFCGPDQKCKAKPTAGFPCGTGCASQYYCGNNGTCAPKLAAGAPCANDYQCDKDLFCDHSATPEAVCAMKGGAGATCKTDFACLSGDCIPGQCMGTNQQCFEDSQCQSRCADDGSYCTTAAQCALGNCSVTGTACNGTSTNCTGGSDVCVFPVQCLPGDCVGDPVCTAATVTADYCTSINNIPSP